MSLLDSIIDKTVGSVMGSNRALPKITSTTFSQTGYSLLKIQNDAITAATKAVTGGADLVSPQLYAPIISMRDYALSNVSSSTDKAAISNAAETSMNSVNSMFNLSLPGYTHTLYDIQNAAGQAITDGISSYGVLIGSVNPSLVTQSLNIGNSALVNARTVSDQAAATSFAAANTSVNTSVSDINTQLADSVQAKVDLANTEAASSASSSTGSTSSTSTTSSDTGSSVFASTTVAYEDPAASSDNSTDVIYQDIKLFIEGVQVPFEAVQIHQGIGKFPQAYIQIPPQAGLMDIARYYQPKVHIFYTDPNLGGDRLLFWGNIVTANYAKSRQQASATIGFECVHKNAQLELVTLEFAGYASNAQTQLNDANPTQAAAKVNNLNSTLSIINALQGITGAQTDAKDLLSPSNTRIVDADVSKLDSRFSKTSQRLTGMPSAMMNFWNQLKKECYSNESLNTIMSKMYIPLVEDGLAFFDRLSGHYYIENLIDSSKQDYCPPNATPEATKNKVMVPPAYRLNSISAIQSSLAVSVINSMLGFSGELTTFYQMFADFYSSVEYEVLTLASPADVPADPTVDVNPDSAETWNAQERVAVETIIKPQIPMYYSPICNVLFPRMYHTIQVNQQEDQIPTRLTAYSDIVPGSQGDLGSSYRAPNSIRESVAIGVALANANNSGQNSQMDVNLLSTTGPSFNVPGKYEQGRGVKHKRISLPQWLAYMVKDKMANADSPNQEVWPDKSTAEYKALCDLHAAWIDRYGYDLTVYSDGSTEYVRNENKDSLDPYSPKSKIPPYMRLMFAAADYEFTKAVVASRSGTVEGVFNPYIVPGYPMEILDDSPNHPSFHAMCASVSHTFTSRSIGTTIGFVGASSYTEMINYNLAPIHPWLQTALGIVSTYPGDSGKASNETDSYGEPPDDIEVSSTIIENPNAKQIADQFYKSVFGIGAAAIDDLYDFQYGQLYPVNRVNGEFTVGSYDTKSIDNGGNTNDYLTTVGNLRTVRRPIEGRKALESKYGITFIDLNPSNYNQTFVAYMNESLGNNNLLEPGESIFLDYLEISEFIDEAKLKSKSSSSQLNAGNPKDRN